MNEPRSEKPLESDCCGQGCTPCVMDLYEQDLKRWKQGKARGVLQSGDRLTQEQYALCRLSAVEPLTPDTSVYTFALPEGVVLEWSPGQHLVTRAETSGGWSFSRQYTIGESDGVFFRVMIKIYPTGRMSKAVREWKVGSSVAWRGPFGDLKAELGAFQDVVMIVLGTGLAPMVPLTRALLKDEDCEIRVAVHAAFRSIQDVLLAPELKAFAEYWNVTVDIYTSEAKEATRCRYAKVHRATRMSKEVIDEIVSRVNDKIKTLFLVCGSKAFEKSIIGWLAECGAETDAMEQVVVRSMVGCVSLAIRSTASTAEPANAA